jgi:hypothetical protein
VLFSASAAFAQKAGDLNIGRTSAGQLAVAFDFSQILELPPILAVLSGWGDAEPGFFSIDVDLPADDFLMLDSGADIRYEVVSFDPAFQGWTQGFAAAFSNPGDQFVVGPPDFDEHPFLQINSDDPLFDPGQSLWQATGRLIDVGITGYQPSDAFTLTFSPVPEPCTATLLLLGSVLGSRRRTKVSSRKAVWTIVALGILSGARPALAQEFGDLWIGRTAAGQLKIGGFSVADNVVTLPPVGGLFNGWSDNDPGFDRIVSDDPGADLFSMETGAQISLVAVEMDEAFRAIDPSFNIMDEVGEQLFLGNESLHIHLTWHINSDDPSFDPDQYLWNATFRLIDDGATNYADSEPFTMHFVNIDCILADVHVDGNLDILDVSDFVDLLLDPAGATNEEKCAADLTFDGLVDGKDIQMFVDLILA